MITDKPVGKLKISVGPSGKSIPIKVLLEDNSGQLLDAVVPLQIIIRDPQSRIAEKSGFYGAANGQLQLNLEIAPNDLPGKWRIEVQENVTGKKKKQILKLPAIKSLLSFLSPFHLYLSQKTTNI